MSVLTAVCTFHVKQYTVTLIVVIISGGGGGSGGVVIVYFNISGRMGWAGRTAFMGYFIQNFRQRF